MYLNKQANHAWLNKRAVQFQGQINRYTDGTLDAELFQQLRLRNGLYDELHSHMLRVAIPYGTFSGTQLYKLAAIADQFDKGYGHFTTRQNIQFNWIKLEQAAQILHQLASVDMHAIQTSGSCVRNITCDHLAGVAADEIEDPRPWCELIHRWAMLHPEFNWLPRKFKIALSGAQHDRAVTQLHDIGLRIYHHPSGATHFRVYVGGGMGRTPVIGKQIHSSLPANQLLNYLQAILRVYNLYGRRDNKYRSRIKILVNDLGLDTFRDKVNQAWQSEQQLDQGFDNKLISKLAKSFQKQHTNRAPNVDLMKVDDQPWHDWLQQNTQLHRLKNYRIVHISLKLPGHAPGDMTATQMRAVADISKMYSANEIRVSHRQNLVLPYVKDTDLYAVWQALSEQKLATPNINTLTDSICCPGLDYCSLANSHTIPISKALHARFDELNKRYDLGDIRINISGCMNACAHHHVGHIGILGVDKKGDECYQITLAGDAGNDARLGYRLGPAVACDNIIAAIERIIHTYVSHRLEGESFNETVKRIGIKPFKDYVYAPYQQS